MVSMPNTDGKVYIFRLWPGLLATLFNQQKSIFTSLG